jgi:predicted transcriptional regulator
MKSILISIKPKYVVKILNGIKKIEVRKGTALYKATKKLIDENGFADFYVYCTKEEDITRIGRLGGDEFILERYPLTEVQHKSINSNYSAKGKVIFKFRCYKVEEIKPFEEYDSPMGLAYKLTEEKIITCQKAQLTYDEYNRYLKGKNGYAIHISDLEIFDRPRELCEFHTNVKKEPPEELLCPECGKPMEYYEYKYLTKAPKSWCYVESGE